MSPRDDWKSAHGSMACVLFFLSCMLISVSNCFQLFDCRPSFGFREYGPANRCCCGYAIAFIYVRIGNI
ncbi:hypothetical protein Y032_0012g1729 [Ancylostoma ceylanicum]|uniref:7TM GPCR serpentine receptor class x (Srx) domain-containing protein n=1 Tax=Ancylostoma ceylanicum TaxID=53326 RepID=A0A016VBX6_9BILA|nr:hypothetical protein Y032_0012g1729 [Ancylostoma ceylanicum]